MKKLMILIAITLILPTQHLVAQNYYYKNQQQVEIFPSKGNFVLSVEVPKEMLDDYIVKIEKDFIINRYISQVTTLLPDSKKIEYTVFNISNEKLNKRQANKKLNWLTKFSLDNWYQREGIHEDYLIGFVNFIDFYITTENEQEIAEKVKEKYNLLEVALPENYRKLGAYQLFVPWHLGCNVVNLSNKIQEEFEGVNCYPGDINNQPVVNCRNDTHFPEMWGLHNTGQSILGILGTSGMDMKMCKGWQVTKGNQDVLVGIIDQGIEKVHFDLDASISALSYNTQGGGPSNVNGGNHGTMMAGIIGAEHNNFGVAGIAPDCKMVSISNPMDQLNSNLEMELAAGIDWAKNKNLRLINCSWLAEDKAILSASILDALDTDIIMVFSAGNFPSVCGNMDEICYPANLDNRILVVGASNQCGARVDNTLSCSPFFDSRYGAELDVVAPGYNIWTTDVVGLYTQATNSSPAAAHVSGLAALILSVNPCLTGQEVRDIIESTCQAVGPYTYEPDEMITGRPNGPWHEEMGYGLIDAEAALLRAQNLYLQNITETGTKNYTNLNGTIFAGNNVDPNPNATPGDYIVSAGSNIDLKSNTRIHLKAGTHIEQKVTFHAHIKEFINDCNNWDWVLPIQKRSPKVEDVVTTTAFDLGDLLIKAYPNPFNDIVTIEIESQENTLAQIAITDLVGKIVYENKVQLENGKQQLELNELPKNGMLLLRICTDGNDCNTEKLIAL